MSVAFGAMNRYILLGRSQLLDEELSQAQRHRILRRSITGSVPYLLATALAIVSAYATLAICGAIALYYALPLASGAAGGGDAGGGDAADGDAPGVGRRR